MSPWLELVNYMSISRDDCMMSYFLERCCLMMTGTSESRGCKCEMYSYHSYFSLMNYYIYSLSEED